MTRPLSPDFQKGFGDACTIIKATIEMMKKPEREAGGEDPEIASGADIATGAYNKALADVAKMISDTGVPRYSR